jgi:hypothetical protein
MLRPKEAGAGGRHGESLKGTSTGASPRQPIEPSDFVEEVWSRGGEWGGTLIKLAAASLGLFLLFYAAVSFEFYSLAFLILVGGGLLLALISYPLIITLERPVRITPEQAVNDFYTALSHHVPHYRRMWLLLSNAGRVSGSYASFEGFRSYWKTRLGEIRRARTSSFTPLKFQVDDFKSEKSSGLSKIDVKFVVKILIRGRLQEGPVEVIRASMSLVKGPDNMWYLDKGTLP